MEPMSDGIATGSVQDDIVFLQYGYFAGVALGLMGVVVVLAKLMTVATTYFSALAIPGVLPLPSMTRYSLAAWARPPA